MGNLFDTPKDNYCEICRKIGDHSATDHKGCKYCLEIHETVEHLCTTCNNKGHIELDHACVLCIEPHHTYYHNCSICNETGHEKSIGEHPRCSLCVDNKKYTHETKLHFKYIDLKLLSYDEIKYNYKRCDVCKCIVYTKDNKCIICDEIVAEFITCPKDDCSYFTENMLMKFCPLCGSDILCTDCLDWKNEYIDPDSPYYDRLHICFDEKIEIY